MRRRALFCVLWLTRWWLHASLLLPSCPRGCCCCCARPGPLVLCEALGLHTLPGAVPLSTSVLSVARNRICNLDDVFRPYAHLHELSLGHNLLARVPRGLPASLESLRLQGNQLTYITAGALRQLGNLTRLHLEQNRIRAVQPGALLGLEKLRVLSLKGNRLSRLPPGLPPSLTHLDVSANCMSALDLSSVGGLVNLHALRINANRLRSVPERAFDRLPLLRSLELDDNLWACECDITYLYRWLLTHRPRPHADLVCAAPLHLAQKTLLALSVVAICPSVRRPGVNSTPAPEETHFLRSCNWSRLKWPSAVVSAEAGRSRSFPGWDGAALDRLSFEDCVSLHFTSFLPTSPPQPDSEQNLTAQKPATPGAPALTAALTAALSALCGLTALLLLAMLALLRSLLLRNQRVAPLSPRAE